MQRPDNGNRGQCVKLLVCVVFLFASGSGLAKPLDILGTSIDLPFGFEVMDSSETLIHSRSGVTALHMIKIRLIDGPAKSEHMAFVASYFLPRHADAGILKDELYKQRKKAATLPGVRSASALQIDGFDFNFVDGSTKDKTYPQAMKWVGVVGGAMYSLQVSAEDTRPLTPQLVDRAGAIHFDRAALENSKARADAESSVAVKDRRLQTPLGDIPVPANADFSLIESFVERDSAGHPEFRSRIFGFRVLDDQSPQTLRLPQIFTVILGCGKQGALAADDYDQFIQMKHEQSIEDPAQKFSNVKVGGTDTLLGLQAQTSTAEGPAVDSWRLQHVGVRRWAAKKGGSWFMVAANRYNGAPIENAMIRQLASAPAICLLDLPFGSGASMAEPTVVEPSPTH